MSRPYISAAVRQRVAEAARYRCGYCQTQQAVVGIPLHIEHIIPLAAGGVSDEGNLWLACSRKEPASGLALSSVVRSLSLSNYMGNNLQLALGRSDLVVNHLRILNQL